MSPPRTAAGALGATGPPCPRSSGRRAPTTSAAAWSVARSAPVGVPGGRSAAEPSDAGPRPPLRSQRIYSPPTKRPGDIRRSGSNWSLTRRMSSSASPTGPQWSRPGTGRAAREHDRGAVVAGESGPQARQRGGGVGGRQRGVRDAGAGRRGHGRAPAAARPAPRAAPPGRRPGAARTSSSAARPPPEARRQLVRLDTAPEQVGGGARLRRHRLGDRLEQHHEPGGGSGSREQLDRRGGERRAGQAQRQRPGLERVVQVEHHDPAGRRHRVQPPGGRHDDAEGAVGAGVELAEVVARDVLHDLAAGGGDGAVGEHDRHADQQVADRAVPQPARPGGVRADDAAERGALLRRVERRAAGRPARGACRSASRTPASATTTRSPATCSTTRSRPVVSSSRSHEVGGAAQEVLVPPPTGTTLSPSAAAARSDLDDLVDARRAHDLAGTTPPTASCGVRAGARRSRSASSEHLAQPGRLHRVLPVPAPGRSPHSRGVGNTLPGLAMPSGSNAQRTSCMVSRSSGVNCLAILWRFSCPTPCSPVIEPPEAMHRSRIAPASSSASSAWPSTGRRTARAGAGCRRRRGRRWRRAARPRRPLRRSGRGPRAAGCAG